MQSSDSAKGWRLLYLLLIWVHEVSANPVAGSLL